MIQGMLTHDEIRVCARGICEARETELGLELSRFRADALAAYAVLDGWTLRAQCPAGVVLEWLTDSPSLSLRAQLGPGAREPAFFDLYVDGRFTGTLGAATPGETVEGTFTWPSTGSARVALYLPHCRRVGLQRIALAGDWTPAPPLPTLLALGDSITQGMDTPHPSLIYPAVAARLLGMGLYNAGVGGYVFDAASLPAPPVADPALITVAYGTNDWSAGRDVAQARPYLARVRALYPATPVVVLAPLWRTACDAAPATGATLADYRRALAAIVADFPGMTYLPMTHLLPPSPEFLSDGTHPNAVGHLVLGANLARTLAGRAAAPGGVYATAGDSV